MTKTGAILSAVFALGMLVATPTMAGTSTKNGGGASCNCTGGSGGNPPGYGPVGGHNKNGGGGNNFNGGGNSNEFLCVVGPRVIYVASARACRKAVHAYLAGHGQGYSYGHGDGYVAKRRHSVSHATQMQVAKRHAKRYRKAKRHHAGRRGHGNTYVIHNHGTINIIKSGAY